MKEYHDYTNKLIDELDLKNYVRVKDYLKSSRDEMSKIPTKSGVYFVIIPLAFNTETFIYPGTGGHYKGNDPNIPIADLKRNWVENADILYIGRAGGKRKNGEAYKTGLKTRIRTLLKFGNMDNKSPHWGGRYLWQYGDSSELLIYWYVCKDNENAVQLETKLINDFKRQYGRSPFANISI